MEQITKNKILLITTKGCDGCTIAKRNIFQALSNTSKKINLEIRDCEELTKTYIRKLGIKDFPAIILLKDDEIKVKYVGSVPTIVILRWIDVHFK